jgi:hypothetical protein
MKLAIITCINGNFKVEAEGFTTEQAALVVFHGKCQVFWNAPDVLTGEVAIVDEQLNIYRGFKEYIHHDPVQPEPEPTELEPETEAESETNEQEGNSDLFGL